MKIYAAANYFDFRVYFGMSGRYKQPVQYGRDSAHESRAAWAVFSLGVYMRERQHIYEDLNESSSANPGGSQQLEILPSPNSKQAAKILESAYISARHQHFVNPPIFCEAPTFSKSAYFSVRRQHFQIRLFFCEVPIFLWICLIFVAANICVYFQYLFMHLSMRQYFWRNCFNLRFKIDIVVMII